MGSDPFDLFVLRSAYPLSSPNPADVVNHSQIVNGKPGLASYEGGNPETGNFYPAGPFACQTQPELFSA